MRQIAFLTVLTLCATPAAAEFAKVDTKSDFVRLISGKTLSRPLVKLTVSVDGKIRGTGAARDVSGQWTWKNGFFCRTLKWGGDDLGYNCQEVKAHKGRIRFTSDMGRGQSADFRLR